MVTLNDALFDLVTKKLVAPEEAYAKAVDKGGYGNPAQACGVGTAGRRAPAAASAAAGAAAGRS